MANGSQQAASTLSPGQRLGPYDIVRLIGAGHVGEVYEAVDTAQGTRVALKTLARRLAMSQDARGRFLKEAEAATRLRHPNVAAVLSAATEGEVTYLAAEFAEGESLAALLGRERPLGLERTAAIIRGVCAALEAAHACGIVHKDLRPHNIIVASAPDGSLQPKVVDFGLARITGSGVTMALSGSTELLQTAHYLAPEQLSRGGQVDGRCDQYAAGVIAYECLTGRTPFSGSQFFELLSQITLGQFDAPRSVRGDIPEPVDAAIVRAMKRSPAERFASAGELGAVFAPFAPASFPAPSAPAPEPAPAPVFDPPPAAPVAGFDLPPGWGPQGPAASPDPLPNFSIPEELLSNALTGPGAPAWPPAGSTPAVEPVGAAGFPLPGALGGPPPFAPDPVAAPQSPFAPDPAFAPQTPFAPDPALAPQAPFAPDPAFATQTPFAPDPALAPQAPFAPDPAFANSAFPPAPAPSTPAPAPFAPTMAPSAARSRTLRGGTVPGTSPGPGFADAMFASASGPEPPAPATPPPAAAPAPAPLPGSSRPRRLPASTQILTPDIGAAYGIAPTTDAPAEPRPRAFAAQAHTRLLGDSVRPPAGLAATERPADSEEETEAPEEEPRPPVRRRSSRVPIYAGAAAAVVLIPLALIVLWPSSPPKRPVRRAPAAHAERAPVPPQPSRPRTARVTFRTVPAGADVFLGGEAEARGQTPLDLDLRADTETSVTFRLAGHKEASQPLRIERNDLRVEVHLSEEKPAAPPRRVHHRRRPPPSDSPFRAIED